MLTYRPDLQVGDRIILLQAIPRAKLNPGDYGLIVGYSASIEDCYFVNFDVRMSCKPFPMYRDVVFGQEMTKVVPEGYFPRTWGEVDWLKYLRSPFR